MADLVTRMTRAAKLEVDLYEEVEADEGALGQATLVVILSSVAAGIGSISRAGFGALVWGTILALVGWYLWAFLTYVIGTKVLPTAETRATYGELLRTIGFSSSPGVIRFLGIIPGLGVLISMAASIWMLVAMVIAVRQALDYTSTWRALAVCLIGFIVYMVFFSLMVGLLVGPAVS